MRPMPPDSPKTMVCVDCKRPTMHAVLVKKKGLAFPCLIPLCPQCAAEFERSMTEDAEYRNAITRAIQRFNDRCVASVN